MDLRTLIAALQGVVVKPEFIKLDEENAVVVGPGGTVCTDVSDYLPAPPRVDQRVEMLNVESFCEYVDRFAIVQRTSVFANETQAHYEAVIDYHEVADKLDLRGRAENAGATDHRVVYTCPKSPQWDTWKNASGTPMTQEAFAQFLEANLRDITKPAAGDFLALALNL